MKHKERPHDEVMNRSQESHRLLRFHSIASLSSSLEQKRPLSLHLLLRNKAEVRANVRKCLTRAGVLYFGHFLGAPREPQQLKPEGGPLQLKAFSAINRLALSGGMDS